MDWATREAEKEQREAQETNKAKEKSKRDERLKEERGVEHFEELHAWIDGQAKSDSGQALKETFSVGKVEPFGGPAPYRFFQVSQTNRERQPMKIFYHTPPSAPYGITVDCGVVPKPEYPLSVKDDGKLCFKTPDGKAINIEQLGLTLLKLWRNSRI